MVQRTRKFQERATRKLSNLDLWATQQRATDAGRGRRRSARFGFVRRGRADVPVGAATVALVAANGWPRPGAADAFAPGEAPVAGGTRLPGTPPTPMVLRSPGYDPEASRW